MHSAKKRDQALIPTLKCAAFPRSVNVGFVKQIHPHATVHCKVMVGNRVRVKSQELKEYQKVHVRCNHSVVMPENIE